MKTDRGSLSVTLLLVLALAVLAMTACRAPTTPIAPPAEEPTEAPPEEPTEAPTEEVPALGGTLTHMTWGGAYTEADVQAFLAPFGAEFGVDYATVDAPAEMLAKLQAMAAANDVTVDTIDAGAETAFQAWSEGLLEPLPADVKADLIAACTEDLVTDFGVAIASYADVMACNADAAERCPTTPAEFWDVENFPGPRMLGIDDWYQNMMFALLADGVPASELFPLDVDRALAKLDELKPYVAVWYSSGEQSQQVLRDEEVVMAYMWDGRAWGLVDQGVNMQIEYAGATYAYDYYIVPKGAPNTAAAFEFLRWYATNPEAQAEWMSLIGYGTCNPAAYELLDPAVAERLVGSHMDVAVPVDYDWLSNVDPSVKERWYTWIGE